MRAPFERLYFAGRIIVSLGDAIHVRKGACKSRLSTSGLLRPLGRKMHCEF